MCGLIGFIGTQSNVDVARAMILAGMVRGIDAAGYCEIQDDGKYHIVKKAGHPENFVKEMQSFELENPVTWLGHTRKATQDNAEKDGAAHPFNGSRFIVFHNGYLVKTDWDLVEEAFQIKPKNGVDSELFLEFLNKFGSIEALKLMLLPLLSPRSRFMLVIYDKSERKVHFIKDALQPFVYRATDQGLFYASTREILQTGIDRKYITFETILQFPVIEFPANGHLDVDTRTGKITPHEPCIKNLAFTNAVRYKVKTVAPHKPKLDPCSGREIKETKPKRK